MAARGAGCGTGCVCAGVTGPAGNLLRVQESGASAIVDARAIEQPTLGGQRNPSRCRSRYGRAIPALAAERSVSETSWPSGPSRTCRWPAGTSCWLETSSISNCLHAHGTPPQREAGRPRMSQHCGRAFRVGLPRIAASHDRSAQHGTANSVNSPTRKSVHFAPERNSVWPISSLACSSRLSGVGCTVIGRPWQNAPLENEIDERIELLRGHGHDRQPENASDPQRLRPGDRACEVPSLGTEPDHDAASSSETT